ncbi:putative 6-phospho-beta-glucosidase [Austwickia sp. TVS 96-490-7B]|uniref:family 4 glycosyl hydrolase n=1 Tax=Austwickia sp. TVS 96-490-7B TaxID=2830843 RepID=UPI001C5A3BE0|nr:6-phospho-beta-glucosidase [Austwickia sp. TVS 96-490-7B]MBW3086958.1 putative 6-phospho-beta-glucosidase [Austwickia sp. TVS 96-490-7B]
MKLTILGGGGFRVPLIYGALLDDSHPHSVDDVALYDVDPGRLAVIGRVLTHMADGPHPRRDAGRPAPRRELTTDLTTALADADIVFCAVRVGGLTGRTCDERVALELDVLGQETTGPGGIAFGLRTLPVLQQVAMVTSQVAPHAWFLNFTNPAGMITQALVPILGDRVVGICDSPVALGRRAAIAAGADPRRVFCDYAGLNHLGWLNGLYLDGQDLLPDLVADPSRVLSIEEGRLFGPEWIATLGAIPNEYLYYYDFTREAVTAIRGSAQTRGEFLLDQQNAFYAAASACPDDALTLWHGARQERDSTYLAEARPRHETRDDKDIAGGGYEAVALAVMTALTRGVPTTTILNVPAGRVLPGLPADAVVEVPCLVDAAGVHPLAPSPLTGRMLGLVQQVKAVEELTIRAAQTRSPRDAVAAFAQHPLVDSVGTARVLFEGYRARNPLIGALFSG